MASLSKESRRSSYVSPNIGFIWIMLCLALRSSDLCAQSSIILTDVTKKSGVEFVHTDGRYGQYFLFESLCSGLALLDFDGDGAQDIFFCNGAPIGKAIDPSPMDALYRNLGDFRFCEVTRQSGVGDASMSLGVTCADYDNDGWTDIYVNNFGANRLFKNNGDGTFSDWTERAGVANGNLVAGGVSFLDMDSDGNLDLYVGNYVKFDISQHKVHAHKGIASYPSPLSFDPEPDTLFKNNGDGTFLDVTQSSGVGKVAGRSMGLVAFDFDADGDTDVFVANDAHENFLFENDGMGHFEEVGLQSGVAFDYRGRAQASMGVALFDLENDGKLDLFVTSFWEEFATLYRNLGGGLFEDATLRSGTGDATFPHVTWGVVATDFDNDGNVDLLVGTGDLDDQRESRGGVSKATAYKVRDILLRGKGGGKFEDLKTNWGTGANVVESSRGIVASDLDGDRLVDAVILNARSSPTLLRNQSKAKTALAIQLVGTRSNRDGIGATIRVSQEGRIVSRYVHSGASYQSDSGVRKFFPVDCEKPMEIEVKWQERDIETWQLQGSDGTELLIQRAAKRQ